MTPGELDFADVALRLHEARQSATPTQFITRTFRDLSWTDARAIALITDQLRVDDGETQIGWKLGWTSEAMRTALGIDRPNWGTLWDTQVLDDALALRQYIHPKIEPELVWRSPTDLPSSITTAGLADLGGEWALGLEVVDPRFPSFDFDALDNTADNSSSAAVLMSEFHQINVDPAEVAVAFTDDTTTYSGEGNQAMSSPLVAVAWLVRSLAEEGLHVRQGDIVFTGGLTAPFDATVGATYRLSSPAFEDAVTLTVR